MYYTYFLYIINIKLFFLILIGGINVLIFLSKKGYLNDNLFFITLLETNIADCNKTFNDVYINL
jgi:hypothetical protein